METGGTVGRSRRVARAAGAVVACAAVTLSAPVASAGVHRAHAVAGHAITAKQLVPRRFVRIPRTHDLWAVGFTGLAAYDGQTLALLYNGRSWVRTATPSPGGTDCAVNDVSATALNDAWAVGGCGTVGFVLHWNGKRWYAVASRLPATATLNGVVALSRTNVWAVGGTDPSPVVQHQTVIMHFNGDKWYRVASPNPNTGGGTNVLNGIAAASPTAMWAVGGYLGALRLGDDALVLRFNGKRWYQVAAPSPGTGGVPQNDLARVSVDPKGVTAWAVGSTTVSGALDPLVERFTGRRWVTVAVPGPDYQSLNGVAVPSAQSAWVVGSTVDYKPLILRWNGKALSKVAAPASPAGVLAALWDVSYGSAKDVYVAGELFMNTPGTTAQALLSHWNGRAWLRQ